MKKIILSLATGVLGACSVGMPLDPTVITNTQIAQAGINEVKLIEPGMTSGNDPRSMTQSRYEVHNEARLLMRLGTLATIDPEILDNYPVILRLGFTNDAGVSTDQLKVCPMTKNWMMFATWSKAHPYKNGGWDEAGGDFLSDLCQHKMTSSEIDALPSDEKSFCGVANTVCFDIRPQITELFRANKQNLGLILLNQSTAKVSIYGDKSSMLPKLIWRELKTYKPSN